jgi:hypothetical protein
MSFLCAACSAPGVGSSDDAGATLASPDAGAPVPPGTDAGTRPPDDPPPPAVHAPRPSWVEECGLGERIFYSLVERLESDPGLVFGVQTLVAIDYAAGEVCHGPDLAMFNAATDLSFVDERTLLGCATEGSRDGTLQPVLLDVETAVSTPLGGDCGHLDAHAGGRILAYGRGAGLTVDELHIYDDLDAFRRGTARVVEPARDWGWAWWPDHLGRLNTMPVQSSPEGVLAIGTPHRVDRFLGLYARRLPSGAGRMVEFDPADAWPEAPSMSGHFDVAPDGKMFLLGQAVSSPVDGEWLVGEVDTTTGAIATVGRFRTTGLFLGWVIAFEPMRNVPPVGEGPE